MRALRILVLAPCLALGAVSSAAAASGGMAAPAPKHPCRRAHTTTIARNATTRVFQKRSNGVTTLYGCLKSRGRAVKLAKRDFDPELGTDFSKIRLAGRFVAWADQRTDNSCKADCPPGYDPTTDRVAVRDLRRSSTRFRGAADGATGLEVSFRGAIAWTQGSAGAVKLYALESAKRRTLDAGAIDPKSLELDGDSLTWTNAGAARSAVLGSY